jgi:hypothetical protein
MVFRLFIYLVGVAFKMEVVGRVLPRYLWVVFVIVKGLEDFMDWGVLWVWFM